MKNINLRRKVSGWGGFILAALGVGLSLTAAAQDSDSSWSITHPVAQTTQFGISPFYGYRFGGGIKDDTSGTHYNFEDAQAYGLFLDYAPTNAFGRFELLWSRQDSSVNFNGNHDLNSVDVTIDVIQVGGDLRISNAIWLGRNDHLVAGHEQHRMAVYGPANFEFFRQ